MKTRLAIGLLLCLGVARGAAAQLTVETPAQFSPPGGQSSYGPNGKFAPGYTTNFALYNDGASNKLLMRENYGYTIYDLANPAAPAVSSYCDIESVYPRTGDYFDTVFSVGAAADGSRILVGYREPHGSLLMTPQSGAPGCAYNFAGEFNPSRGWGESVVQNGSRYIGFGFIPTAYPGLSVADVTDTLSGSAAQVVGSIPSEAVPQTLPPDGSGTLAGNYLVYASTFSVNVVDVSAPGPAGSISSGLRVVAYDSTTLGLPPDDRVERVAAAVHPENGKLYLMTEGVSTTTFAMDGYVLGTVDAAGNYTRIGARFVPAPPWKEMGAVAAVAGSEDVYFFAWNEQTDSGGMPIAQKLMTLTANTWPVDHSPDASFPYFAYSASLRALPIGTDRWALYLGSGQTAYAQIVTYAPPARQFYTLAPCRLVDTRAAEAPALAAGETRAFALAGKCGVPAQARSLAVNVTAVAPSAAGYLTLFSGIAPQTSNVSFRSGRIRAGMAVVSISGDGAGALKIRNTSTGSSDVLVDVSGYFQ